MRPAVAGPEREAERQRLLLAVLLGEAPEASLDGWLHQRGRRAADGLAVYRANAGASAERALAADFPVVQALLGERSFAALARALWHARPPAHGDLARFGEALPGFVESQPQLADLPYLGDVARLEQALASAERAADAPEAAPALERLAQHDPAELALVLRPGTAVVASRFPIVAIVEAHRDGGEAAFAAARDALAAGRAEHALVWRRGWRAGLAAIDAPAARFTAALLDGASLGRALDAGGDAFALDAWLLRALGDGWLLEVRRDDGPELRRLPGRR